jgi:hypothetical protein
MTDFANTRLSGLYEDAIGQKNQGYYLYKFEDFDERGPGVKLSWNWAAFFFTGFWALYRKMYGWFFAWGFFGTVGTMLMKVPSPQIQQWVGLAYMACFLGFAAYANSIYHHKVKKRIASAQRPNSDAARVSRRLSAGGGVHAWMPIVFGAIPVVGIVAAVALPTYQDYAKRSTASIALSESVNSSDANQSSTPEFVPFSGTLDEASPKQTDAKRSQIDEFLAAPSHDQVASPTLISDKQILKKQGVGGNQELADVTAWGDAQMSARFFDESEFGKARSFVLMWQQQIIRKIRLSPERALFLGYSIVTSEYDQHRGICRPDMSKNGGIEDLPGVDMKISPECFVRN